MGHLTLRWALPGDESFLLQLYASTREADLAGTGWSDGQRHAFVVMQFHAQDRHYRVHFPQAQCHIIERDGEAVGRLYRDTVGSEIRIIDISVLTQHRGLGIGQAVLRGVQSEAQSGGHAVVLRVESDNRARRLYQSLGFVEVGRDGLHISMRWSGDSAPVREQVQLHGAPIGGEST